MNGSNKCRLRLLHNMPLHSFCSSDALHARQRGPPPPGAFPGAQARLPQPLGISTQLHTVSMPAIHNTINIT